jgi:hypothetical protein
MRSSHCDFSFLSLLTLIFIWLPSFFPLPAQFPSVTLSLQIDNSSVVSLTLFLQGGPGSIFSRAAVQKLASYGNFSIWEIPHGLDDQKLGLVLLKAGIDPGGTASSAFFQYYEEIDKWTNSTVKDICPSVESLGKMGCHKFVAPLNQIVFYHGGGKPFEERLEKVKKIWNAPSWVYFYSDGGYGVKLCRYFGPKLCEGRFVLP